MVLFKQKCRKCKKNYVLVSRNQREIICYDCQKEEMKQEIKDRKMKKMFDIPEDFYKQNSFLRSIKINYIRYGSLSERQIEAFKQTVEKLKKEHGKDKPD